MLARATSSDESPTPGYMYGEIAKMTLASFDACKQIEDYLLKRCGNKNANVKNKALLIIKHVASSGRPEFSSSSRPPFILGMGMDLLPKSFGIATS